MSRLHIRKMADYYDIVSGISTSKEQAGHGDDFVSYRTVYGNYYLPAQLDDLMSTSSEEQERFSVKVGDVFLTRTSETLDELAISSVALKSYPRATFSGFLKRLRPKQSNQIDPKFAAFYFRSSYFRKAIDNAATMTTRASFNDSMFEHLPIALPPYDEQIRIGQLLHAIEAKRQLNVRINHALLEALAVAYNYWFTQFDFPDEQGCPYRASGGSMVWNERLRRDIPEGWIVETVAKTSLAETVKAGVDPFDVKRYLATGDIIGNAIGEGTLIDFETRESRANMQPQANTVWFAKMKNSVKHLFLSPAAGHLIDSTILSTGFFGMKCRPDAFAYVAAFISNPLFEALKDLHANGATQQAVNNSDLASIPMLTPPTRVLREFQNSFGSMLESVNLLHEENQLLLALRDWLSPLLMNGQASIEPHGG